MIDSVKQAGTGQRPQAGSLADLVAEPEQPSFRQAFPPSALVKTAALAVLFGALNYWQFPRLVGICWNNPNWAHGFVIPLFSIYLLYARRGEFLAAGRRVFLPGLPLTVLSILFIVVSFVFIHMPYLCNLGMVALLLSLVMYLGGPRIAMITWLPIAFLAFAMPIPDMLYSQIALPLQNLAAKLSTVALRIVGSQIEVSASALTITSLAGQVHHVTVAEACSGVRSLMAFLALGVAWAYLEQRPIWQRAVLVLFAAPIAILCNVIRVTTTCGMFVLDKPEMGQNFMHEVTGIVMLAPALAMFWGLSKLLEHLFVEVEVEDEQGPLAEGGQV